MHNVEMKEPSMLLVLLLHIACERAHIAACERMKKKSDAVYRTAKQDSTSFSFHLS